MGGLPSGQPPAPLCSQSGCALKAVLPRGTMNANFSQSMHKPAHTLSSLCHIAPHFVPNFLVWCGWENRPGGLPRTLVYELRLHYIYTSQSWFTPTNHWLFRSLILSFLSHHHYCDKLGFIIHIYHDDDITSYAPSRCQENHGNPPGSRS